MRYIPLSPIQHNTIGNKNVHPLDYSSTLKNPSSTLNKIGSSFTKVVATTSGSVICTPLCIAINSINKFGVDALRKPKSLFSGSEANPIQELKKKSFQRFSFSLRSLFLTETGQQIGKEISNNLASSETALPILCGTVASVTFSLKHERAFNTITCKHNSPPKFFNLGCIGGPLWRELGFNMVIANIKHTESDSRVKYAGIVSSHLGNTLMSVSSNHTYLELKKLITTTPKTIITRTGVSFIPRLLFLETIDLFGKLSLKLTH